MSRAARRAGLALVAIILSALAPAPAWAKGFTETAPKSTFIIDEAYLVSWVDQTWDHRGRAGALADGIERYEPGGGKQGVLVVTPRARYQLLVTKLQYGILDSLTVALGIPAVINTVVDPGLSWEPGDYMHPIGRPYTEEDFWAWAASMGQPKPTRWKGNRWALSDVVVGARYRWTDPIRAVVEAGISSALTVTWAIPTGRPADPEEVVALGTTMWDLHTQGDLAVHLGWDKHFRSLDYRLTLGLDLFYEVFFERTRKAATGALHPLLLNQAPYVGDTYRVKPGDFAGFSFEIGGAPYMGPARATWLNGYDMLKARELPPILSVALLYSFVGLQQTDWRSEHALWDWGREKLWRPGYKNILEGRVTVSFLRLGAPLQVYASYRTLTLIPGKNCRAPNILSAGIQIPLRFW
ncbi:MAG: hypothetical protein ABIK09_14720 [Pseudomonadota bacterium]